MSSQLGKSRDTLACVRRGLRRRNRHERLFRMAGIASLALALLALLTLFTDIVLRAYPAFVQTEIRLRVDYEADVIGIDARSGPREIAAGDFDAVLKSALSARFPDARSRSDRRKLFSLLSSAATFALAQRLAAEPALLGRSEEIWLLAHADVDAWNKAGDDDSGHILSPKQIEWVRQLKEGNELRSRFNSNFFTNGDSRNPEMAGIWGATVGSVLTLGVTLLISFPLGVAAAVYLEEFAPRNRWTDLIEVNINNLAAVPSIIFGLLGLAIFIGFFGMPRSASLVGGLVLALMTFPTIIIASRVAIRAVPPSIRDAALGLGASQVQMVLHHVLPYALPGMLTGAIIGMARALGETAPLLMIGMVAFIVDVPGGFTDSATVLPVQVYLWADSPERGFTALTSAAIMVLLVFLVLMNALAVYLRNRFEKRW